MLDELVKFLKKRNKEKKELFSHPFVLMLVGSVLVTVFAQLWSEREHKNLLELQFQKAILEKQFDLLDSVQANFHKTAFHLNAQFQCLIGVAEESIKPDDERDNSRFAYLKEKGKDAEKNYEFSEPFGSKLDQIKVIFGTEEVKKTASNMGEKWTLFEGKMDFATRQYNVKNYRKKDLEDWDNFRKSTYDELKTIKTELVKHMCKEISIGYGK